MEIDCFELRVTYSTGHIINIPRLTTRSSMCLTYWSSCVITVSTHCCLHRFCSIFIPVFLSLFSIIYLFPFLYLCLSIFPSLYIWCVATISESYQQFIDNLNVYWRHSCIMRLRHISDFAFNAPCINWFTYLLTYLVSVYNYILGNAFILGLPWVLAESFRCCLFLMLHLGLVYFIVVLIWWINWW